MKLLFAWRYFKNKKSTAVINIIAWISVVAITVGTAALIIVLSVFNGFEGLVKSLYGDFYSDIRITAASGKYFSMDAGKLSQLKKLDGVRDIATSVEEKAVLTNGDYQSIVYLRGVDANYASTNKIKSHVFRGDYFLGYDDAPALVLGAGIENAIAADPLSINSVVIYLPNKQAKTFSQEAMNSYNAAVAGSFIIQQEFDNRYAFTNIAFMRYMLDLAPNQYSSLEISANPQSIKAVIKAAEKIVGDNCVVQNKYQQNQSLYAVMQMEKWVVYAILCLILVVAAFNMIGALTMLVLEKQKDISILRALGATNATIQQIFLFTGLLLAFVGATAGVVIALIVCYLQQTLHIVKLSGGSFIIDYYPVKLLASDFVLVSVTVLIVALLAAWMPAYNAARNTISLRSRSN